MQELMTSKQVAQTLRISPTTLQTWRTKNKGPQYLKIDQGAIRYRPQDVQDWIDSLLD